MDVATTTTVLSGFQTSAYLSSDQIVYPWNISTELPLRGGPRSFPRARSEELVDLLRNLANH